MDTEPICEVCGHPFDDHLSVAELPTPDRWARHRQARFPGGHAWRGLYCPAEPFEWLREVEPDRWSITDRD